MGAYQLAKLIQNRVEENYRKLLLMVKVGMR